MVAKSHMIVGASTFIVAAPLVESLAAAPGSTQELAVGALVAGGAALLPDIDTPHSAVSGTFGVASRALALIVGLVFGGHRRGSHTLWFCAGVFALAMVGARAAGRPFTVLVAGAAAWLVLQRVSPLRGLLTLGAAAIVGAAAASASVRPSVIAAAVLVGCLSHLLADLMTGGIRPLWPIWRRRVSLPIAGRTGSFREVLVVAALVAIAGLSIAATGGAA
jgi:membrane-bound metal-dependent hydrolase YbcI (DUF457 family)